MMHYAYLNSLIGRSLALYKGQVNPHDSIAEAFDFGHEHSVFEHLIL